MTILWNHDNVEVSDIVELPEWMEEITCNDLAAIIEGGCASGAYMPAVTYYTANQTMAEHGNQVLEFIEEFVGELPDIPKGESWDGVAVFFLSYAVELWAASVLDECEAYCEELESEE